ncbi:MAG: TraR/DksA C4-type zinc finger protein [Acidimicrobiales bacterium]|nr:TraR/DksA C4-type zinc finger protein [Acidimicrobiales bacterium]
MSDHEAATTADREAKVLDSQQRRLEDERLTIEALLARAVSELPGWASEAVESVRRESKGRWPLLGEPSPANDPESSPMNPEQLAHLRQVAEQCQRSLAEIEAALDRLKAGTYGTCEGCGGPIPSQRLEIIPASRLCVECLKAPARGRLLGR